MRRPHRRVQLPRPMPAAAKAATHIYCVRQQLWSVSLVRLAVQRVENVVVAAGSGEWAPLIATAGNTVVLHSWLLRVPALAISTGPPSSSPLVLPSLRLLCHAGGLMHAVGVQVGRTHVAVALGGAARSGLLLRWAGAEPGVQHVTGHPSTAGWAPPGRCKVSCGHGCPPC